MRGTARARIPGTPPGPRYNGETVVDLAVWDKDRFSKDEILGTTSLSIEQSATAGAAAPCPALARSSASKELASLGKSG